MANAVAKSMGSQQDYETQPTLSNSKVRFHLYLRQKIAEYLTYLLEQEETAKVDDQPVEKESTLTGNETETILIEFPDGSPWQ